MPYVMQIVCDATGQSAPFDGQYVVEYDPTRRGSHNGWPMSMHLVCTRDIRQARRFGDAPAVMAYWKRPSGRPYPADRPLTRYTIYADLVDQ